MRACLAHAPCTVVFVEHYVAVEIVGLGDVGVAVIGDGVYECASTGVRRGQRGVPAHRVIGLEPVVAAPVVDVVAWPLSSKV